MKKTVAIFTLLAQLATSCKENIQKTEKETYYPVLTVQLSNRTLNTQYTATISGVQTVEIRPHDSKERPH